MRQEYRQAPHEAVIELWDNRMRALPRRAAITLGTLLLAFVISYLFVLVGLPEANIAIVHLLAVLVVARLTPGYVFGFIAAVIASSAFNFFFAEPFLAFTIHAPSYIITFLIMTITSLVTSAVTSHAKQNERLAQSREAETKALYTLTNRLTDASCMRDIAAIATGTVSRAVSGRAACFCFDENGRPEKMFLQQVSPQEQVYRPLSDGEQLLCRLHTLHGGYDVGPEFHDWPIHGRENILGVIRIPKEDAVLMDKAQTRLLRSIIESTALAMDRLRSAEQRRKSNEEAAQERYRSNLLRAISHDLRTPLSGIMGTAEMIMKMTAADDPRRSLAAGIHQDADWLHALVENILSLTRLQDGKLPLRRQLEAVEEVIGSSVRHVALRSPQHEITVHVPDKLLLVSMDATLIQQVLINLLDNAIKHTPPGNEISISVAEDRVGRRAIFSVKDRGEGIPPADQPHIFEMFYTSRIRHSDARYGIGLGLTICQAIVQAHGGGIAAHNRSDGPGAEMTFTLPLEVESDGG